MRALLVLSALSLTACGPKPAGTRPAPVSPPAVAPTRAETITVRDPAMERELARIRIDLLERSAQLEDTERRLGEATTEVVRAMARLRTLATRAEAASSIAEAEVTVQQLKGRAGAQAPSEVREAEAALRNASAAFDAENFGGAVYLATQAKRIATAGRGRLAEAGTATRPGERALAVPVPLTTTARANLRAAPGGTAEVIETVPAGTALTAYAASQEWLRVTMSDGRSAWIHQSLAKGNGP
jgi:hypothetical protein